MLELAKALVIDDDPMTRRMISSILKDLNFISILSSNGRHAWETLWDNPDIKLVVTDMMMADMDGGELVQIIRGNQAFKNLPIIIVSGVASPAEVEGLLRLGPCRFCGKPINAGELRDCVSVLLGPSS